MRWPHVIINTVLISVIGGGLGLLIGMAFFFLASIVYPAPVRADPVPYVIGDSICEGVAAVAPSPGYTRRGALTHDLIGWLRALPKGSPVIFCAGTNDAAARSRALEYSIKSVFAVVRERDLKMTWVGPVRTSRSWDRYSDQADTYLALCLASAGIRYVSLRAMKFSRADLAGDGVHFSRHGYWRIAKLAGAIR